MKKIGKSWILLAAIGAFGLAGCDNSNSSTADNHYINNIVRTDLPKGVNISESIDLDEYITTVYADDTESKEYYLTCSSEDVKIDGHLVSASKIGTYTIEAISNTSEDVKNRFEIRFVDDTQQLIDNFLAPLSETPKNYTARVWSSNGQYYFTFFHTENYMVIMNESDMSDEGNNMLFAVLNDGNGYFGTYDFTYGSDVITPKFNHGRYEYDQYYYTMDLNLDSADFSYQDGLDSSGNTKQFLVSTADFESTFLLYGLGMRLTSYGYSYQGAAYLGMFDTDGDNEKDGMMLQIMVGAGSSTGTYCLASISDIGTTDIKWMDNVIKDESYIPEWIESNGLVEAFDTIEKAGNYTITTDIYSSDTSGNKLEKLESNVDMFYYISGGFDEVKAVTSVTSDGIMGSLQTRSPIIDEATGEVTGDGKLTDGRKFAYFNRDGKAYSSSYTEVEKTTTTKGEDGSDVTETTKNWEWSTTEIEGITDVFKYYRVSNYTVTDAINQVKTSTVTSEGTKYIDNTEWTGMEENNTYLNYLGNVGNGATDEDSTKLFRWLFNMNGFYSYGNALGQQYATGYDFSLSIYGEYTRFQVNKKTNEIDILVVIPNIFSDLDGNIGLRYTISNIGTTTNDFSQL